MDELQETIKNTKNRKATRLDGINVKLIKHGGYLMSMNNAFFKSLL